MQFFPKQKARNSIQQIDAARQIIETSLPRFVAGQVRRCLLPHRERYALLAGAVIWPHDADQQALIDGLKADAVITTRTMRAAKKLHTLHLDAFVAFMDQMIRNFPSQAKRLLIAYANTSTDDARIFNAVEILREHSDFGLQEELEITKKCDPETLYDLYHELAHESLEDIGLWEQHMPNQVECFADRAHIVDASVDELEFQGGEGVSLTAYVSLKAEGLSRSYDDEESWTVKDALKMKYGDRLVPLALDVGNKAAVAMPRWSKRTSSSGTSMSRSITPATACSGPSKRSANKRPVHRSKPICSALCG